MIYYSLLFQCSECGMELPSLEILESHIWSKHLRKFPFRCAVCGFPAIAHASLDAHFKEAHHPDQPVEFQRKVLDELRLRNIVANSIVPSLYEDVDLRHMTHMVSHREDQPCELSTGSLDADLKKSESWGSEQNEQRIEVINVAHESDSLQLDVVNEPGSSDRVPFLDQNMSTGSQVVGYVEAYVPKEDIFRKVSILRNIHGAPDVSIVDDSAVQDGQHITRGTQIVQIDDNETANFYQGHENGTHVVDRALYDFQHIEGNNIGVATPSNLKSNADVRIRLAKQQHIDATIKKFACRINGRSKRRTTVYECEECGKIIRYPSKINEHRRSHRGIKPYECIQCGQRFSQKGGLTCHLRLHTGERPYTCTWDCGKSFYSNSALKMHEKTHSGERPYSCEFCGKLFTKRSHCLRHESCIHPKEVTIRTAQLNGLAAAGADEDRLRKVVNGVIEEVRIERSLRKELKYD